MVAGSRRFITFILKRKRLNFLENIERKKRYLPKNKQEEVLNYFKTSNDKQEKV